MFLSYFKLVKELTCTGVNYHVLTAIPIYFSYGRENVKTYFVLDKEELTGKLQCQDYMLFTLLVNVIDKRLPVYIVLKV